MGDWWSGNFFGMHHNSATLPLRPVVFLWLTTLDSPSLVSVRAKARPRARSSPSLLTPLGPDFATPCAHGVAPAKSFESLSAATDSNKARDMLGLWLSVRAKGLEPLTPSTSRKCSTN